MFRAHHFVLAGSVCLSMSLTLTGCSDVPPTKPNPVDSAIRVRMDYANVEDFWSHPFPNDVRRLANGTVDLSTFPNPSNNALAAQIVTIASSVEGFGTTMPIWFSFDGPLEQPSLPSPHATIESASPIVLIDVDPASPEVSRRFPLEVHWLPDGGPYGAPNLLALVPQQGISLRPNTKYAAVIRTALTPTPLGIAPAVEQIAKGTLPQGMTAEVLAAHRDALEVLANEGIAQRDIAGFSVFTTGEPMAEYARVAKAMIDQPLPTPTTPFVRNEMFDDFCVYETTIGMPVYQTGKPPYTSDGGGWVFDTNGNPVVQRIEEANFVVTIPRMPMPAAGYPLVVLSRTGAGGERPLVDRGVRAAPGGPATTPGTGPAFVFAQAGFAGASVDGPHGGLRNVTKGDEQFLVFNVGNPVALRDNIRQSAAELGLFAHILKNTTIDVNDCPGATTNGGLAQFDLSTLTIMGHSMGASIVPLTVAFESSYKAMLLSGAGGSFLNNIVHKQKPLATKSLAEVLMGIAGSGYSLTEADPLLGLLQWAGESADIAPYAGLVLRGPGQTPRHVLMMQGIVDHYILPPIANTMSLSVGLDLAGPALDESTAELDPYTPIASLLDLQGRGQISLPAQGNIAIGNDLATAIVVQHPEDGIEDGHEIVFQTEPPKHQMRCFLESLKTGVPRVPVGTGLFDPCN